MVVILTRTEPVPVTSSSESYGRIVAYPAQDSRALGANPAGGGVEDGQEALPRFFLRLLSPVHPYTHIPIQPANGSLTLDPPRDPPPRASAAGLHARAV